MAMRTVTIIRKTSVLYPCAHTYWDNTGWVKKKTFSLKENLVHSGILKRHPTTCERKEFWKYLNPETLNIYKIKQRTSDRINNWNIKIEKIDKSNSLKNERFKFEGRINLPNNSNKKYLQW